jgi:hypothetical protein
MLSGLAGVCTLPKFQEKLSKFFESAITWGAVGVLVGAIGPFIPPLWGFAVTFVFLIFALLKTNVFEGRSWTTHIFGNLLLSLILGGVLFGVWHILPKPKEPPTADEIAEAVYKRQHGSTPAENPAPQSTKPTFFRTPATASEIADEFAKRFPDSAERPIGQLTNKQIRDKVIVFAKNLRDFETAHVAEIKKISEQPTPEGDPHTGKRNASQAQDENRFYQTRFRKNYWIEGVNLCDELRRRLPNEPPLPNMLLDFYQDGVITGAETQLHDFADYLDKLANKLPQN